MKTDHMGWKLGPFSKFSGTESVMSFVRGPEFSVDTTEQGVNRDGERLPPDSFAFL